MLSIWFNCPEEKTFGHPDAGFQFFYEDSWFKDPIVKSIVKDIDGGIVTSAHSILVEPYGDIACTQLSSTCRNIILAYKLSDVIINATFCGDKAGAWLLRIGEMKDITIALNYALNFPRDFTAHIVNDHRVVHTWNEYAKAALDLLYTK